MGNLLIRQMTDGDKRRLRVLAAEHGRSMSEEARLLLSEQLATREESNPSHWVKVMLQLTQAIGGIELESASTSNPTDPFAELGNDAP